MDRRYRSPVTKSDMDSDVGNLPISSARDCHYTFCEDVAILVHIKGYNTEGWMAPIRNRIVMTLSDSKNGGCDDERYVL